MSNFNNGTFSIKDGTIHYSFRNNGEPVFVFIYGGFGDLDMTTWDSLIQKLPGSFSILTYDRPGIGLSKSVTFPRTASEMASELKALLEFLGIKQMILIGHSIGGLYARFFASRFTEHVKGLLLLDATHEDQFKRNSQFLDPDGIHSSIESLQNNPEGMRIPHDPDISFEQMRQYPDLPDSFHTFVVAAEKSIPLEFPNAHEINKINMELQENLARTSCCADFVLAKGSSHFIYLDQTELTANLIRKLGTECEAMACV